MTLPSLAKIDTSRLTEAEAKLALRDAMEKDLPLAVQKLKHMTFVAANRNEAVTYDSGEDKELEKQLLRIHSATALRDVAQEYFCQGQPLNFFNCHATTVGALPKSPFLIQIENQNGALAMPDC